MLSYGRCGWWKHRFLCNNSVCLKKKIVSSRNSPGEQGIRGNYSSPHYQHAGCLEGLKYDMDNSK